MQNGSKAQGKNQRWVETLWADHLDFQILSSPYIADSQFLGQNPKDWPYEQIDQKDQSYQKQQIVWTEGECRLKLTSPALYSATKKLSKQKQSMAR